MASAAERVEHCSASVIIRWTRNHQRFVVARPHPLAYFFSLGSFHSFVEAAAQRNKRGDVCVRPHCIGEWWWWWCCWCCSVIVEAKQKGDMQHVRHTHTLCVRPMRCSVLCVYINYFGRMRVVFTPPSRQIEKSNPTTEKEKKKPSPFHTSKRQRHDRHGTSSCRAAIVTGVRVIRRIQPSHFIRTNDDPINHQIILRTHTTRRCVANHFGIYNASDFYACAIFAFRSVRSRFSCLDDSKMLCNVSSEHFISQNVMNGTCVCLYVFVCGIIERALDSFGTSYVARLWSLNVLHMLDVETCLCVCFMIRTVLEHCVFVASLVGTRIFAAHDDVADLKCNDK